MVLQKTQCPGGEMAKKTSAKDWSTTSLGAMENWPQSLRATVHVCFASESPASICWGTDLTFIFNDAWKNLFKESPESLGLPADKVFKDRGEMVNSYFKKVLKHADVQQALNQPFTLRNGEEQQFNFTFSPVFNEDGAAEGIFSIAKSSKYNIPEKQLQQREQELSDFFDNAPIGIHWLAADGTILRVNQTELDMLGYSREEFVGRDITEFFVDKELIKGALQQLKNGEEIHNCEAGMIHKDGSIREISLSSNVHTENGEFVHTRCFISDITERKKAKAELRDKSSQLEQQKRLYEAILSSTPDLIYVFDLNYRFIYANDALLEMWGLTREEYWGKTLRDIGYEEWHAEMHEREIDQLVATKQPVQGEVSFPHTTLGERFYEYIFVPVLNDKNEVEAVAGTARDVTERKKVEQALRRNEKKYRTLVDNFPKGAVGLFDENLRYTALGGKFLKQVGVTSEERIGEKITDIYPEEIVVEVQAYFQSVFKGEASTFKAELHDRQLLAQTLPIENDEGTIISGMLVVQDITERWQAQQELRESEGKFRMMAENLNEVIWMASEDGEKFTYINPAFEDVWGIDREKIYDDTLYFINAVHPEDRDRVKRQFAELPENEFDDIYRIIRPDGEVRWLHTRGSKVFDENSQITRILGISEDITERKQAEQQLRKSRNRLKTALDIDTVGVIFWGGDDLTITETNDAFLKMSGFSREEVIGKSWRELTPEEFYSTSEEAIESIKTTGHTEPYEKQYIRKDGTRWWGLFAPRSIDENEAVEFVVDITDRKEAQTKLEKINATLEERVEERTKKLRSYQNQLRTLASQLNRAEERERQRLATELHDTFGQMLAVAKMKVKGLQFDHPLSELEELEEIIDKTLKYNQNLMTELKPPPVLNKEDVTEVLYWTAGEMKKQGLDITVEDDGKPKPVDEELRTIVHQSVRELFQNVKKHADTNKVRLVIAREKDRVKVVVEDKGKGFEVKESWLIPTKAGRFGLFNIKERLDWHGGTFEIYSEPDNGTKAVLSVPLKDDEELEKPHRKYKKSHVPPELTEEKSDLLQKVKVLLVDDHQMVRRGLRQLIEKQEDMIIIGEASHGQEAIELAHETSPDVIVMDVNMPVMGGIEATQIIKNEISKVRIIGLSLHESQDVIKNMKSAGASAYLSKNEAFESLIMTIRAEAPSSNGDNMS